MNKVNEKRREAHEKWSCLIPRAAAALFLYITSQREHLGDGAKVVQEQVMRMGGTTWLWM
ncbi:hypothetical protein PVAP13_8NG224000 [Panicum virgatum]|uniref:Uncharacterized protein n=1 Tax=Panicum virgatum TaxID=38727 RepID=A0A8T0P8E1_PANVG|nr:hypothetical protein PVAP13_8NG224000 [Panicum virgatum]